jgi:hypothetical protein
MLKKLFSIISFSLFSIAGNSVAAKADVTLDPPFALSGSAVHALYAIFAEAIRNDFPGVSDSQLSHSKIFLNDGKTAMLTFIQDGHLDVTYRFEHSNFAVSRSEAPSSMEVADGFKLSGLAAKALYTVYNDWIDGKLMILSKEDLDADRFKIKAHELINPHNNLRHYWITYYPEVERRVMTGCPVRESYGVDVGTWNTIVEGTIC